MTLDRQTLDRQPERTGPRLPHSPETGSHRVPPHRHGHAGRAHLHAPAVRASSRGAHGGQLCPVWLSYTACGGCVCSCEHCCRHRHYSSRQSLVPELVAISEHRSVNAANAQLVCVFVAPAYSAIVPWLGTSSSRPMWWCKALLRAATSWASR